jgi:uncharacterized repeat protein (TIGR03806 family)
MGAFSDLAKLTPVPGFIEYDVNCPLWSDGAIKRRWVGVPSGERIKFFPTGSWSFPDGTVFIKHFDMVTNEVTGARRRLETRFLVRQAGGGVYGVTYKWRPNESDADLVSTAQTEKIQVTTADGVRTQTWYYPSPMDCLICHNTNAGDVLGVNCRQINRELKYADSGVSDNQLRAWSHIGMFDSPPEESAIVNLPALVRVDDSGASLEARARSYLDANCAQCHRPNGAAGYFDARYDTPLKEQGLIDGRLAKQLEMPKLRAVCPGDLSNSAVYQRACTTDSLRMPPLAKNVNDETAIKMLGEWIESLAPTAGQ